MLAVDERDPQSVSFLVTRVVAFPTERLLYGLGRDATKQRSRLRRISQPRGRRPQTAIAHVADEATARPLRGKWPDAGLAVLAPKRFWPGPIPGVPKVKRLSGRPTTAGRRIQAHFDLPIIHWRLQILGSTLEAPIAAPTVQIDRGGSGRPLRKTLCGQNSDGGKGSCLDGGPCRLLVWMTITSWI